MSVTTPPLKAVVNDTRAHAWCGPTVVAAITGKPISTVKGVIKVIRQNDKAVRGTDDFDVCQALKVFGYTSDLRTNYKKGERPTLAAWLRGRTAEQRKQTIIVHVTGHWVVVRGNTFIDTFTKGQPVRTSDAPRRRIRVEGYFVVRQMDENARRMVQAYRSKTVDLVETAAKIKKIDPAAKSRAAFYREIKRLKPYIGYDTHRGLYITLWAEGGYECTKWSEWDGDCFDSGDHWQEAADFLKGLKPEDFRSIQRRKKKAA